MLGGGNAGIDAGGRPGETGRGGAQTGVRVSKYPFDEGAFSGIGGGKSDNPSGNLSLISG